jgi:hypothetical protein
MMAVLSTPRAWVPIATAVLGAQGAPRILLQAEGDRDRPLRRYF